LQFDSEERRAFCGRECYAKWQSANAGEFVPPKSKVDMETETRGACLKLEGPCKFTSCRCHLGSPDAGMKVRRLPMLPEHLCAIKAAGEGNTLDAVAKVIGCTRERIRQIENVALRKLVKKMGEFRP
jgi:hypothetical protein